MALTANTQWEVRVSGNDNNGGGFDSSISGAGSDYSQQDAAQQSWDGATNILSTTAAGATTLVSNTALFTSAMVGNLIQITSGTNFTAGFYQITQYTDTTHVVLDRTPTSGAAGSAGVGSVGGALVTIGKTNGNYVAGNIIYIKSGTYTLTTPIALTTGGSATAWVQFLGYGSSRNDNGTKPLITTSSASTALFTVNGAGYLRWRNLKFTSTGSPKSPAIQGVTTSTSNPWALEDCLFDGVQSGIDTSSRGPNDLGAFRCTFQNCSSHGWNSAEANPSATNCVFYNNTGSGYKTNAQTISNGNFLRCIFAKNAGSAGWYDSGTSRLQRLTFKQNTFVDNTGAGLRCDETSTSTFLVLEGNIFYGNGTYGTNFGMNTDPTVFTNAYNAYGNNTTAARNNLSAGMADIALSGDPFTNRSTQDYSLNNTTGAGAACRSVSYPGTLVTGGTGYMDLGVLQHADPPTSPGAPPGVMIPVQF